MKPKLFFKHLYRGIQWSEIRMFHQRGHDFDALVLWQLQCYLSKQHQKQSGC